MKRSTIKLFFILVSIIGVFFLYLFVQDTVQQIRTHQKQSIELWVKTLKRIVSSQSEDARDLSFIYSEIVTNIDFPAILADPEGNPINWRNIDIDTTQSQQQINQAFKEIMADMDEKYEPVKVTLGDTLVLQVVHYGDSQLIKNLQLVPFVSTLGVAFYFLLAYLAFKTIKQNEESSIWVGLAKETAHQLGTPLTSLMGWIELLKHSIDNPERQSQILMDVQADLNRLNRITTRFSKIGSEEEFEQRDVVEVIEAVYEYYRRRIPNMNKHVELEIQSVKPVMVKMNRELMEWVFENITKNAIDSINHDHGKIEARLKQVKHTVLIELKDNGKGIASTNKSDIFRPGFSTKKRGWGLGLSLAKRIVENYHNGALLLKDSKVGVGTTFLIRLNKA
jgi:K+-sensing histidine kinase KdpD